MVTFSTLEFDIMIGLIIIMSLYMSLNSRNSCTISIRLSMTSEYLSARNSNLVTLSTLPKFLGSKQLNFEATVLKCSNCLVMLFIIQSSAKADLHFAGQVHKHVS